MKVTVQSSSLKPKNIEEMRGKERGSTYEVTVNDLVELTEEQYKEFTSDFRKRWDFLEGVVGFTLVTCKEGDYQALVINKGRSKHVQSVGYAVEYGVRDEVIQESAADTAEKIRAELMRAFPELPLRHFKVRSSMYAGGSSVSVRWKDYPLTEEVNEVVKRFESASFDGMTDMKSYEPYRYLGQLYSGADYVTASRDISDERYDKINEICKESYGDYVEGSYESRRDFNRVDKLMGKDIEGESYIQSCVRDIIGHKVEGLDGWNEERIARLIDWVGSEKWKKEYKNEWESGGEDKEETLHKIIQLEIQKTKDGIAEFYNSYIQKEMFDAVRGDEYTEGAKGELLEQLNKEFDDEERRLIVRRARSWSGKNNEEEIRYHVESKIEQVLGNYKPDNGNEERREKVGNFSATVEKAIGEITEGTFLGTKDVHNSRRLNLGKELRTKATNRAGVTGETQEQMDYWVSDNVREMLMDITEEVTDSFIKYRESVLREVALLEFVLDESREEFMRLVKEDKGLNDTLDNMMGEPLLKIPYTKNEERIRDTFRKIYLKKASTVNITEDLSVQETGVEEDTEENRGQILQNSKVIISGVFGWNRDNGYKVDEKAVLDKIDEDTIVQFGKETINQEDFIHMVEDYIFSLCKDHVQGTVLTKDEKELAVNALKIVIGGYANEGVLVTFDEVKEKLKPTILVQFKQYRMGGGEYVTGVKKYIEEVVAEVVNAKKEAAAALAAEETETRDVGIDLQAVISSLIGGIVTLEFEKADGTRRLLVGSRSEEYDPKFAEINQKHEIAKQLITGTIPVWDLQKGAFRAFRGERLISYTVDGETIERVRAEDVAVDVSKHFDPTKLSTANMIKALNKNVVRLVFEKADKTERVMWATRNHALIELYQDPGNPMIQKKKEDIEDYNREESLRAQVEKDYVKVFDLTVNEFRTFKPSKVLRMDETNNVASWIEFKPKQDGWYNSIYANEAIGTYYEEGKRQAKASPERANPERINRERELQRHVDEVAFTRESVAKQIAEAQKRKEAEENKEPSERSRNWKETNEKVKKAVAAAGELTEQDNEVYRKMKDYVATLHGKLLDLQREGKGRGAIEKVTANEKFKIVMFDYYDDKYILHPRFMVNGISHKVFADRTGEMVFEGRARSSEGDTEFSKEFDTLASYITGRRQRAALDVKLQDTDIRRLKRLGVTSKKYEDKLKDVRVAVRFTEGSPHAQVAVGDKQFYLSPAYVHDVKDNKTLFKRDRHTSTLAEFTDALKSHEQLGITKEAFDVLMKVAVFSFDLRKRIKDEDGNYV